MPDRAAMPGSNWKSVAHSFSKGVDNRSDDRRLDAGYCRDARNVVIARDGAIIRRDGYTQIESGRFHSLWSARGFDFALVVNNGQLSRIDQELQLHDLCLVGEQPVRYGELNGEIYWLNSGYKGVISAGGELRPWGLPVPTLPTVAAHPAGGLRAGTYQVTLTARSATGIESGAPPSQSVDVPSGGGIILTDLVFPSGTSVLSIYLSDAGGDNFRWHSDCLQNQWVIGASAPGRPLETLLAREPIPGNYLGVYRGSLVAATGKMLWWTLPLAPHLRRPRTHSLLYADPISMLVPVSDGIYVGAGDRVFFLAGTDPKSWTQQATPSRGCVYGGPVPGHAFVEAAVPDSLACWCDATGQHWLGLPGGVCRQINARVQVTPAVSGSIAYLESKGARLVLSTGVVKT